MYVIETSAQHRQENIRNWRKAYLSSVVVAINVDTVEM